MSDYKSVAERVKFLLQISEKYKCANELIEKIKLSKKLKNDSRLLKFGEKFINADIAPFSEVEAALDMLSDNEEQHQWNEKRYNELVKISPIIFDSRALKYGCRASDGCGNTDIKTALDLLDQNCEPQIRFDEKKYNDLKKLKAPASAPIENKEKLLIEYKNLEDVSHICNCKDHDSGEFNYINYMVYKNLKNIECNLSFNHECNSCMNIKSMLSHSPEQISKIEHQLFERKTKIQEALNEIYTQEKFELAQIQLFELEIALAIKTVENYNAQYQNYLAKQSELAKLEIAKKQHSARLVIENYNWHLRRTSGAEEYYTSRLEELGEVFDPSEELARLQPYTAAHSALAFWEAQKAKIEIIEKQNQKIKLISEKKILTEKISQMQKEENYSSKEVARLSSEVDYESNRRLKHSESAKNQCIFKLYKNILKPNDGIGDKLLECGRAALENGINAGLVEFGAKFTIRIASDYNIYLSNKVGAELAISLGSGYQKFVLSLAARLAIWRLTTHARPDAFIIDEGFGACDDEYLDTMTSALEVLAQSSDGPKLLFVVTHLENMKVKLERVLQIQVRRDTTPPGNKVSNSDQILQSLCVRVLRPEIVSVLPADPNKEGNLYCSACKQSILKSSSRRHLESEKHRRNIKT